MGIVLRGYQKQAVNKTIKWFDEGVKGVYIADGTGVGKTIEAFGVIKKIVKKGEKELILICLPPGLRPKWIEEIKTGLPKNRKYIIFIVTYTEIIKRSVFNYYMQFNYSLIVFDEFHYLKEFSSKRTLCVLGAPGYKYKVLADKGKKLLALSATPFLNRIGEIYTWLWKINHELIQGLTYEDFIRKYAAKKWSTPRGLSHKGLKNEDEFVKRFRKKGFIRRQLDDVVKNIPPFTRDFIPIECSAEIYQQEKELLKELLNLTNLNDYDIETILNNPAYLDILIKLAPSFEQMTTFKKQIGLLKVKPVMDYLKNSILPSIKKFILFTYHTDTAYKYGELLTKSGIPVNVVTGAINPDERYRILEENKHRDEHILVASIKSIKEGLNLNEYTHSFFAEIDWAPYIFEQAEGRNRRFGQTKPVFWTYFTLMKGIEKLIYRTLIDKQKTIKTLVG